MEDERICFGHVKERAYSSLSLPHFIVKIPVVRCVAKCDLRAYKNKDVAYSLQEVCKQTARKHCESGDVYFSLVAIYDVNK